MRTKYLCHQLVAKLIEIHWVAVNIVGFQVIERSNGMFVKVHGAYFISDLLAAGGTILEHKGFVDVEGALFGPFKSFLVAVGGHSGGQGCNEEKEC